MIFLTDPYIIVFFRGASINSSLVSLPHSRLSLEQAAETTTVLPHFRNARDGPENRDGLQGEVKHFGNVGKGLL